jgi:hypothetical protein
MLLDRLIDGDSVEAAVAKTTAQTIVGPVAGRGGHLRS